MDTKHKSIALLYDTLIYLAKNHNINSVESVENIHCVDPKERNIIINKKGNKPSTHIITNEVYIDFTLIDVVYVLHTAFLEVNLYTGFYYYVVYTLPKNEMLIIEAIVNKNKVS